MNISRIRMAGTKSVVSLAVAATVVLGMPLLSTTQVRGAYIVDPISAIDNGDYNHPPDVASAAKTIDGSGLSNTSSVATGAPVPAVYPTNLQAWTAAGFDNNYTDPTVSNGGTATPVVTYTLASLSDPGFDISGGHFWQYGGDVTTRSLLSVQISVSSDGVHYTPAGTLTPGYMETADSTHTVQDPGVNFSLLQTFHNVRDIALTNFVSYGGDQFISVGFGEIRFINPVPEPSSMALALVAATALVWQVRRRRRAA